MFSLFSLSTPSGDTSGPQAIDLQLLPDEEILRVWDQSQTLISILEEKNIPIHMTAYYIKAVEQELQHRSQLRPQVFFSAYAQQEENGKDGVASSKKPTSFANTILATNILI